MTTKAVAAVFVTVVAPVLVALGMKWVDKVELPLTNSPPSKTDTTDTAGVAAKGEPSNPKPANAVDAGATAPATGEFKEIPLQDGWVFHPIDPGTIDVNRFLFRPDGTIAVSANGPKGILLRPGDYEDFKLSVSWRVSQTPTGKRTAPCGVLVRSGLDHWPDNRIEAAFATGKAGRLRWGKNVTCSSDSAEENDVIAERNWHVLEIDGRGDTIEVRIDGAVVCTATNVSRKTGRVGMTVMGRDMEYRDFHLERLPSGAPGIAKGTGKKTTDPVKQAISPVGKWRIQGRDGKNTNWTGDLTLVSGPRGSFTGQIEWSGKGGRLRGARGREVVSAEYTPATRTLKLHGERVEDGKNLNPSDYLATLAEDGETMTLTSDDFPGEWKGERNHEP